MTSVKYNVKGVEPGQDFDTPLPQGMYTCRIDEATLGTSQNSGNERIALTMVVVTPSEHENRRIWDYVSLTDESAWKMRQFLEAVGKVAHGSDGKDTSGTIDLDAVINKLIKVRVKHENDSRPETLENNNNKPVVRHRVGSLLPLDEDVDDDEPEDDEPEDEETADEEEDLTFEDLAELNRTEMKALVKDNDLGIRVTKQMKTDTLRAKIAETLGLEPAEEEDDDEGGDDYDDWEDDDLKTELKQRELPVGGSRPTLIKRLRKDDESSDGEPF